MKRFVALFLVLAPFAEAAEPMVAIRGKEIPASRIDEAYGQVREKYAYDRAKSKVLSLKKAEAVLLTGRIKQRLGSNRVVLETDDGELRVLETRDVLDPNRIVTRVARAKGTYSLRLNDGRRVKADLFLDLTISAHEFLALLRRGQTFKEVGELSGSGDEIFRNKKNPGPRSGPTLSKGKPGLKNQRHETGFERRTTEIKRTKRKIKHRK